MDTMLDITRLSTACRVSGTEIRADRADADL
jgi:hypothetical protein